MSQYQSCVLLGYLFFALIILSRVSVVLSFNQVKPTPAVKDTKQNDVNKLERAVADSQNEVVEPYKKSSNVKQLRSGGQRVYQKNYEADALKLQPDNSVQNPLVAPGSQSAAQFQNAALAADFQPKNIQGQGEKVYKRVGGVVQDVNLLSNNAPIAQESQNAPSNQQQFQNALNAQDSNPKPGRKYRFTLEKDTHVWQAKENGANEGDSAINNVQNSNTNNMKLDQLQKQPAAETPVRDAIHESSLVDSKLLDQNANPPPQDQNDSQSEQRVESHAKLGDQNKLSNDIRIRYDQNELPNDIPPVADADGETAKDGRGETGGNVNRLYTLDNRLVLQKSQEGLNQVNNYNNRYTERPIEQPILAQDNLDTSDKKVYKFNQGETGVKRSGKFHAARRAPQEPTTSTLKPTPKSRPDASARKDVIWFGEYHSYSLRASVDNNFRIRYAPIPAEGTPWPMPQFYYTQKTAFYINPYSFSFNAAGESCDILEYTMERVAKNMFGDLPESENERYSKNFPPPGRNEIRLVNVTVLRQCDMFPHLDMDESYDLEVRQTGAVIIARQIWGAVRGLETFSQLLYQDQKGRFVMNKTLIHDFPRFKHRGILLDTSRHYLKKETILLNLEAMAQNKMNVFHWHIVDEQSFPFVSHTYPNLTKNGAYDEKTHIYTHEVIMEIIEEARVRGIRVIPEFDTPGHTFAWGLGQDNLLTPCYDYSGRPDGYFGPINPILKSTYKFLEGLFREVLGLFKDKYVHLGGDEVSLSCWNTNPYLQRFMNRNGLYDVKDLLNVYTKKLVDIIGDIGQSRDQGTGYIVWQEVFDDGVSLKPDAIVQIWKGNAWDLDRVTSQGLRALFSSCWYLDYISYGQDWDKYYMCTQLLSDLDIYSVRNQSLIMGGDVCLWTEYADDESILPRIWPRASAAAERLWSSKSVVDLHEAATRIEEQRCRMKRRGIPVGVLSGPGYCRKYKKPGDVQPEKKPFSFFNWQTGEDEQNDNSMLHKQSGNYNRNRNDIYMVDMNSMYVIPLLIIVCVVCLTLLAAIQDTSRSRILAILAMPVKTSSRRGFKTLLYVFMVFAVVWCVWTAPIWMHAWENHSPSS